MPSENQPPNVLFKLVVVASAVFVVTILLMIVTGLGPIESRLVGFFNEHGMKLILIEAALILFLAVNAMALDRRQTIAAMKIESESKNTTDAPAGCTSPSDPETHPETPAPAEDAPNAGPQIQSGD